MIQDNSDQEDALDMRRLSEGHDAALNDLMERHGQKLFHYLLRALQDETEAGDLAQETFVRVYQNRERFKTDARFTTWLYTIATNLVRDRFRFRSRHSHVSLEAGEETEGKTLKDNLAGEESSPSEVLQAEERAEAVREAVARLPEELRMPLILAEYEELSHLEIGAILGCSAKAVETRIYRAKQQLRSALKRGLG